jgi:hypothetical protein
MTKGRMYFALSLGVALGTLGAASALASDHGGGHGDRGGYVVPGSLDGVNPAYHPDIFGNAATAYAYGFVQSKDGTWQVRPDWRGGDMIGSGERAWGYAPGATRHRFEHDR